MDPMQTRGDPFLEVDGVRIDERDVEALYGIDEHGSMYRAAEELGRSYARIQRRVSELEETLGPLVSRRRGGAGGGGSTLTDGARDLLARFERLRAEFSGLARAEESVFSGRLVDRDGLLGTVDTEAGTVRAIVADAADADAIGTEAVQVGVRSDAVALATPDEVPDPSETSVRNRFEGAVEGIESEGGVARVTVDVGSDDPLRTLLTETSLDTLDLSVGDPVVASFKATAARAVSAPGSGDDGDGAVEESDGE